MVNLTKLDKELLSYLATNGPSIGNRIETMRNVARTSKKLESTKLIERIPNRYDPHPRPASMLYLTVEGLAHAFIIFFMKGRAVRLLDRPTLDKLDVIIEHWNELLPDVFEKWNFFRENNVDLIASQRLIYAAFSLVNRYESMGRAGHLWTPKRNVTHEEHMRDVFTRFFYDLIYDPTFSQISYLAKWVQSKRKKGVDIRDAPLLLWVAILKKNPDTRKKIDDNISVARSDIDRLQLLSALLGSDEVDIEKLSRTLVSAFRMSYP